MCPNKCSSKEEINADDILKFISSPVMIDYRSLLSATLENLELRSSWKRFHGNFLMRVGVRNSAEDFVGVGFSAKGSSTNLNSKNSKTRLQSALRDAE